MCRPSTEVYSESQLAYLQAMGIPAWQSRQSEAVLSPAAQVPAPVEPAAAPIGSPLVTPSPAATETLSFADWLLLQPLQLSKAGQAALWGSNESGLLVLSECLPGYQSEAPVTQPFFGPHGKMLDAMLKGIDLGRRQCNIAVLAEPESLADASLSLGQLLEQIKPRLVLLFCFPGGCDGRVDFTERKLHGQMQIGTCPCIISYHPYHLLDHPEQKRDTWEDLKTVRQLLAATNDLT